LFREAGVWGRYKTYILGALALLVAQAALIAGLLVQRRGRRKAEEQTRASQAELHASYELNRELSRQLLIAQEAERSTIARELHDGVSQEAALLANDLQLLGVTAGLDRDAGLLRMAHLEAATRAQNIARAVRNLSRGLHPTTLRLVGLPAALKDLTCEFSRPGIEIAFSQENVPAEVPYDLSVSLYRVAQAAVQNAVAQGAARKITVELRGDRSTLHLKISDDGIGFDVSDARAKGLTLLSMGARIQSIGGRLKIQSGLGTTVEAVVPLQAAGTEGKGVR
jgi:two-component system NarL family sensor kinase